MLLFSQSFKKQFELIFWVKASQEVELCEHWISKNYVLDFIMIRKIESGKPHGRIICFLKNKSSRICTTNQALSFMLLLVAFNQFPLIVNVCEAHSFFWSCSIYIFFKFFHYSCFYTASFRKYIKSGIQGLIFKFTDYTRISYMVFQILVLKNSP